MTARVLHVVEATEAGVAKLVVQFATGRAGDSVLAVRGRYGTETFRRRVTDLGLRYEEVPLGRLATLRAVRRLGAEHDIVFLHSGVVGLLGRALVLFRLISARLVYVPHGSFGYRGPAWRLIERVVTALTPSVAVLFVSHGERDDFTASFGASRNARVGVVAPYIDVRVQDIGADASPPLRLVTVGRLVPARDPGAVASFLNELTRNNVDLRFTWIGDGPLRAEFLSALDERARPFVEVTGWVDDVEAVLEHLRPHLSLLLSQFEGLSQATLETMAKGIPPIVTAVGGNRDAVADGVSGFFATPALAARLTRFVGSDAYEDMRRAALDVARRYTRQRSDAELSAFLGDVLAPPPTRRT